MKEYVASRELSVKLKDAGFPQETEFYWAKDTIISKDKNWKLVYIPDDKMKAEWVNYISAPLTDELLKWLPARIEEDDMVYELEIYKTALKTYMVTYPELHTKTFWECFEARNKTLPNALAEMGIYLNEGGLL